MIFVKPERVFLCFNRCMNKLLVCLLSFLLTGCVAAIVPLPVLDAERFSIRQLLPVDKIGLMAISADGRMLAWSDSDLELFDIESSQRHSLLNARAETLRWSFDGALLAATTYMDGESHLYVYDRSGVAVFDTHFAGRVGRLQWSHTGQLTAGVLSARKFSFGTHIKGQLLSWDGRWRMTKIPLFETTIKPTTAAQLADRLYETFDFDLSPLEDEVLYTRLYAPPAFAATRYLVLHNLQTGEEKQIASLPMLVGKGRLAADGESAYVTDGKGQITLQDLWSTRILQQWTGTRFDYDPRSEWLIADGGLYQGQQLQVQLPPKSFFRLSSGGHFLLVSWNRQLYLLSDYSAGERTKIGGVRMKKLQKLRRLRSRGLIEQAEYLQARERLLQ